MKSGKILATESSTVMLLGTGSIFSANAVDLSLTEAQMQSVGAFSGPCGESLYVDA